MSYDVLAQVYYITLIVLAVLSVFKIRFANNAIRVILLFIVLTAIAENVAHYLAVKYQYNLVVFHIYNPLKILLISIFFNEIIPSFKKKRIGIIIGIVSMLLSILNSAFIQTPDKHFDNYILVYEAMIIILMCLFYFYDYLNQNINRQNHVPQEFYITCLLLIFWSFTLLYWFIYPYTNNVLSEYDKVLSYILLCTNLITYTLLTVLSLKHKQISIE